jgi:hypothetical protein
MLTLPHLGYIKTKDPYLGETIEALMKAVNQHGLTVGVDPTGTFPAPDAPNAISVVSVPQGLDVSITDNNPRRGEIYFVDYALTASFAGARTEQLGASRNVILPVGATTWFVRAYSSLLGSEISPYTVFGGTVPRSVLGGAANPPQASQGTGAGSITGASPNPPTGGGLGPVSTGSNSPRNVPGGRFVK